MLACCARFACFLPLGGTSSLLTIRNLMCAVFPGLLYLSCPLLLLLLLLVVSLPQRCALSSPRRLTSSLPRSTLSRTRSQRARMSSRSRQAVRQKEMPSIYATSLSVSQPLEYQKFWFCLLRLIRDSVGLFSRFLY